MEFLDVEKLIKKQGFQQILEKMSPDELKGYYINLIIKSRNTYDVLNQRIGEV